jgi:hypothetical protein
MTASRRYALLTALAVAVPCASIPAFAQQQVQLQRPLDANPQMGSGGLNPAQVEPDYAARNNIITGNVTGLGYFHGRVGYTAPGEFRGNTGDDLFRFRAQSWSPNLPGQGLMGAQSLPGGAYAPASIYTYSAPTTAGQVVQYVGMNLPYIQPPDGSYRSYFSLPSTLASPSRLDAERVAVTLGAVQQDGRVLEINASPLMGVYMAPPQRYGAGQSQPIGSTRDATDPATGSASEAAIQPAEVSGSRATAEVLRGGGAMVAPTMVLGAQLQSRVLSERVGEAPTTLDERVAQIRASMFSPLAASYTPGEDAYLDLLAQVRRNQDVAAGREPRDDAEQPVKPEPERASRSVLREPTPEEQQRARLAKLNADRALRGLPPIESPATQPAPAPAEDRRRPAAKDEAEKLLESLEDGSPRLKTLAGTRDDRFNAMMRRAESDLAAGRYFDAEERYRQAVQTLPNNPLGAVGVVHAQLGSGLVRSAAFNLRSLFERHPEVIGVRYEANLLPPPQRLEWVRTQCEQMLRNSMRQEPALMLAYLGFQTNSPGLTRYGLDLADARQPGDPLVVVLRRVWLGETPEAPGISGTPAVEPPDSGNLPPGASENPASPRKSVGDGSGQPIQENQ